MSLPSTGQQLRRLPDPTVLRYGLYALLAATVLAFPLHTTADSAGYLCAAGMILDGALPYVGVMDVNPPLVLYLHTVPAYIARLIGLNPIPVFLALVAAFAIWAAETTRRVLREHDWAAHVGATIALAPIALTIGIRLFDIGLHEFGYGQREHLFAIAVVPFLSIRWLRWEGEEVPRVPAVVVGIAAGIAACLKPHFVMAVLACEAYLLATRRRTKPLLGAEIAAFAAVGVVYATHFALVPTAMREAFLGRWLPLIAQHYRAYDRPLAELLRPEAILAAMVAASPWIALRTGRNAPSRRQGELTRALAVFTAACVAMYFAQGRGFSYHLIPAAFGATLIVALVARIRTGETAKTLAWYGLIGGGVIALYMVATGFRWQLLGTLKSWLIAASVVPFVSLMALAAYIERHRKSSSFSSVANWIDRRLGPVIAGAIVALSLGVALAGWNAYGQTDAFYMGSSRAQVYARYSRAGDRVLVVSTGLGTAFPSLVQMNRLPASRYYNAFPIALFRNAPDAPDIETPEERRFLRELAGDIEMNQPTLIAVTVGRDQALPDGFSIDEYLERSGFIAQAMGDYVEVPAPPESRLRAFVRKDGLHAHSRPAPTREPGR